ncbi:ABC transporter ATP-binding protein [Cellulomonas sp. PhB143]|uniref:ABC transporter ATP-binding protein n=1 Tax=Cellulomonas sp. PhB143 TaxID=2485186 RepID=UPI000F469632|nr:ABC transporter ATP-binding protein [Cellulomonas sp. PhB143]ROS76952.1 simple sugar transport system ATP-binding protein [Cellulomonas sp. PhB143]
MKLELQGITKRFGPLVANDAIDLVVEPGQIHALLGENGAGKSTLMNVLFGLYTADEGTILLDGQERTFRGPRDALAAGIGMVHQHFMLVPVFTVAESVMLGHEDTRGGGFLDLDTARRRVRELSDRFGFGLDPDAVVEDLPVGVQQRVEIVKALAREAKVLILDEPTAVLTPQETDDLIGIMRQLKDAGTSIVFITHKLREVKEVADTITVIRRGAVVGSAQPDASENQLAELMVGREVSLGLDKAPPTLGDVTFVVEGLTVRDSTGHTAVDGVSFSVAQGEILAVAGVQGNGQTELTEAILGVLPADAGSVTLAGRELVGMSPHDILAAGLGFVPEDRKVEGLVLDFTVGENLVLDRYDTAPFARGVGLDLKALRRNAQERIAEYDIRTQGHGQEVGRLSGGNQQKVVVARELSRPLKLFIASQPTRGVDVGSIEFLHRRIVAERDAGTPVIIVSTELDEVAELADRIAVMYEGRIVGIVAGDTPRSVLGLMMAGVPLEEAREQAREDAEPEDGAPGTPVDTGTTSTSATGDEQ